MDSEIAGVQAWRTFASPNARHVQNLKSEARKKNGVCETHTSQISSPGKVDGQITRSLAKKKIDLRNCINFLKVIFEMSRAICPSKPSKSGPLRDIEDNIILDVPEGPLFEGFEGQMVQNAFTSTSAEILSSISLRGPRFEGFEGQMARDISKMTFKKLIQFRKSIFFFRNAPRNLPLDLPRTRYLRGLRFANLDFFRVSLFTF